jgi:hypothetical protein
LKKIFTLIVFCISVFSFAQIQHCGYDFTSYLVVDAHEEGVKENAKNLKISIVTKENQTVININNQLSWKNSNKPLVFKQNYTINKEGEKERWFFPYATDQYFLSITNTFPADNYKIKIEDLDGVYQTQFIDLFPFNMYILCSSENEKASRQFGPRSNRPIEVILLRNNLK